MILLDTNVIYYLTGLSYDSKIDIEKLQKAVSKSNDASVSSLTVVEILNKYKKQSGQVRRIFTFLRENRITLIQNKFVSLKNHSISSLCKIKQKDLDLLVESCMHKKIKIESEFSSLLWINIFSTYLILYSKDEWKTPINDKGKLVFKFTLEEALEYAKEELEKTYRYGYLQNNCEKLVKNKFNELLEKCVELTAPTVKNAFSKELKLDFNNISTDYKKLTKKINKSETILKYISGQTLNQKKDKPNVFLNDCKKDANDMLQSLDFLDDSLKIFLINKYLKMIEYGESFRKNDLTDNMILEHLTEENDIICTFDIGLQNFIDMNPDKKFINSLSYIKSFYI